MTPCELASALRLLGCAEASDPLPELREQWVMDIRAAQQMQGEVNELDHKISLLIRNRMSMDSLPSAARGDALDSERFRHFFYILQM